MTTTTISPTTSPAGPAAHPTLRRPGLARLTGVELRKLTDTRAGYWLLIVIALAAAAIVTVQLFVMPDADQTFENFFVPSLLPVGILLPVLGILLVTGEWSQRTAMTTFALVPQRSRVLVAKLLAAAIAALASVLASLAVAAIGTALAGALGGAGTWSVEPQIFGYAAVFQVINVVMGVAFGMLFLNTPLAIVLYLVLPTVWSILSEMISGLRRAAEWLDLSVTTMPLTTSDVTAGQWGRIAVSVALWVLLPLVAGLVRIVRREVS
ncbi:ABC transporter permease [Micromonospora sp. NBC_01699]|uniref:ABC transporter permease n=1 Tax=Micromonospora sp. NBC_01699 TaxID=2975984 RepID=UPI002E366AB6|nr:ABC transporter permease [Micromonospora sp. NBC_01699]